MTRFFIISRKLGTRKCKVTRKEFELVSGGTANSPEFDPEAAAAQVWGGSPQQCNATRVARLGPD